jgi:SAM-dependent methyltransferase
VIAPRRWRAAAANVRWKLRNDLAKRYPPPARPWTEEYAATHVRFVSDVLDDGRFRRRFTAGSPLPREYGVGLDERVVEFPWVFARRPRGRVLDAGSSFNHAHILDRLLPQIGDLHVVTLAPEERSFLKRRISYVYADLRDLPFRNSYYDTVLSVSTLEHVGMDNTQYGSTAARAEDARTEAREALVELKRVVAPGGQLLFTVPFGRREDHGWMRQLNREDLDDLVGALGAVDAEITVYAYSAGGWQVSDVVAAAGARYRDYMADPTPVEDLAAAARAVACVRVAL